MKKILLTAVISSIGCIALAQDTIDIRVGPRRFAPQSTVLARIDTNEILYDKEGKTYKYAEYSELVNSGAYTVARNKYKKWMLVKTAGWENLAGFEKIRSSVTIKSPRLAEGTKLRTRELSTLLGNKALEGKAVMLYFWSADCTKCTDDFATLNKMLEKVAYLKDIAVVAITADSHQKATKTLNNHPFPFADKINSGVHLLQYYGVNESPSFVITDRNHIIRFTAAGTDPLILTGVKGALQKLAKP